MEDYYVYIYLDPRKNGLFKYGEYEFDYEPFYIGKDINGRCYDKNGRSKYFKRIVNKIKESGLEPSVVKLKENLNEQESFILEMNLIKSIGRKNLNKGPLVNFTDGGDGCSGLQHSKKTKDKISENHANVKGKNNPMFGKFGNNHHSYGKHRSEESKRKQSETMNGKYLGDNNPKSILKEKDVIKILRDLNEGILVQKEIAKKFGVDQTTISNINVGKSWKHIKIKGGE